METMLIPVIYVALIAAASLVQLRYLERSAERTTQTILHTVTETVKVVRGGDEEVEQPPGNEGEMATMGQELPWYLDSGVGQEEAEDSDSPGIWFPEPRLGNGARIASVPPGYQFRPDMSGEEYQG